MFNPCCCGVSCVRWSDDFNRADSTSLGSDYTEVAGNWEILSNELKIATSNAACEVNAWDATQDASFQINFRSTNSGDKVQFILLNSGTDYLTVEFETGTGTVRVWIDNTSHAHTKILECSVSVAHAVDHTFRFLNNSTVGNVCRLFLNGTEFLSIYGIVNDVRVGTGTITGPVYFDNAQTDYEYHAVFRPDCLIDNSYYWFLGDDGYDTASVDVTIAGASGDFLALNGLYTLPNIGGGQWRLTGLSITTGTGTITAIDFAMNPGSSGSFYMGWVITTTGSGNLAAYNEDTVTVGSTDLCDNDVAVPVSSASGGEGGATVSY